MQGRVLSSGRPSVAAPRPVVGRPTSATAGAKKAAPGSAIHVYTKVENDDIGIQTLVGDYAEKGMNHGRKYYQKMDKIPGHEETTVFLYYWDTRDGPEFTGWWFGDQVGGSQVWSRASAHSDHPPTLGWRIPWDGPVKKDLLFVEAVGGTAPVSRPTTPTPMGRGNVEDDKVAEANESVNAVEAESNQVLENVRELLENATEDNFAEAESMLKAQQVVVQQAQKSLAQDINEARIGGAPAAKTSELSKLLPKLRNLQTSLLAELSKAKNQFGNTMRTMQTQKKAAEAGEKLQMQEARDAKALQDALPQVVELVTAAEDGVEHVAILAAPLSTEEEMGEGDKSTMDDIEEQANKATTALQEARRAIGQRLSDAKNYAPEAKKVAIQELQALQTKLNEATKRLNPLKKFRQDFEQRAAAKKAVDDIATRLSNVELEVEKAFIMTVSAGENQMAEDEVKNMDDLLGPAAAGIQEAMQMAERRSRSAGGFESELQSVQERAKQAAAKLEEVRTNIRRQKEGLTVLRVLGQAHEKVEQAEAAFMATAEAEMPFLRGLEALSQDEAMVAVKESEAAAVKMELAMDTAKTFIKSKIADAKTPRYSKISGKKLQDDLNELLTKAEGLHKKLRDFKKETSTRKTSSLLQDVVDKVAEAEIQVQTLGEVAKLFSSDNLSNISTDMLRSTCEQTVIAEKDASESCNEARKVLSAKQKDAKDPSLISELSKLQQRLNSSQHELTKLKKSTVTGERLIKAKQVLTDEEVKVKEAEEAVTQVETLATPKGDEKPSEDTITKIDAAVETAQSSINAVNTSIDSHMSSAMPALKASLSKLLARTSKSQEKVDAVKDVTKGAREKVNSKAYVRQANEKTDAVDTTWKKVQDAEMPFLKGIENPPLPEAKANLKASEEAADAMQKALNEARTFIASKSLEVRRFAEELSKPTLEEFQKLTERVNTSSQQLNQFRRETEGRRRIALMQEAAEKVAGLQAEVAKAVKAAQPLAAEDLDAMTPEKAKEVCDKLGAIENGAQATVDDAKAFLIERQKDVKGHATEEEKLKALTTQLNTIQLELDKSKKAATESEQKFVAKKLIAEAGDSIGDAETEVEKATETAAALLSEGGSGFLVESNVLLLAEACKEELKKKGATKDSLFKQLTGAATPAEQAAFVAGLAKLPDLVREDLAFSPEQCEAIFKHLDGDKDGKVSSKDFQDIFQEKYVCVAGVAVTDKFDVGSAKSLDKLGLDEAVIAKGPAKTTGANMERLQCKVVKSGKEGWVTVKGNGGTLYMEPFSPYASFTKALDRLLDAAAKKSTKAQNFLNMKHKELAECTAAQQPLMDARGELAKLKPRVVAAQKKLEELRRDVAVAKKEFAKKEEAEKRAQQEIRDKKTAASILAAVGEKVDAMEAVAKRLEEAAHSLVSAEGNVLEAFATPISVTKDSGKVAEELEASIAAVKAVLTSHQGTVARASRGALAEAKQTVAKIMVQVDATVQKAAGLKASVKAACGKIVSAATAKASAAFRTQVERKSHASLGELFVELAKPSKDVISEASFCKVVQALPGLELPAEQATLLAQHVEADGIRLQSFLRAFQQHYVCVKQIAMTSDKSIQDGKAVRTLEVEEVVEVLEGPVSVGEDKAAVTRIRGQALSDGTTGWVSVKGNQGTPFLQETEKPFLCVLADVPLEPGFRGGEAPMVRELKADEVLEVLEGPRKDKTGDSLRVRAKSCKDGAMGWLTSKDREGVTHTEAAGKYYVCTQAIAMTDKQDIKECKVLRKLEVKEVLKVQEGPTEEEQGGLVRLKGQSMRDGLEGWVTVKGNAGTVYAEESSKYMTITMETPLQKRFSSESAEIVRMLAKDEAVEVLEGPKEERFESVVRAKGKALVDGAVGWVSVKEKATRPWTPFYKVSGTTVLQDGISVKGAATLRKLEVGESVEVLEGPLLESDVEVLRVRARLEKDGVVGWITVRDAQGTALLTAK